MLSAKGRLKLRRPFVSQNDRVFLTNHIGPDEQPCLRGFSPECWLKIVEEFERLTARGNDILRMFYLGGAHELPLDKNGSIAIPPRLLRFARLTQRVALVEMRLGDEEFWLFNPRVHRAALKGIEGEVFGRLTLDAFLAKLK